MKLRQTAYKTVFILGLSVSLFGCATPEIQKMSAIDAVKFGKPVIQNPSALISI